MTPKVCMISLWRNDETRNIEERTWHLLHKTGVSRWIWVEGDSGDDTLKTLHHLTAGKNVTIVHHDTLIKGDDPEHRMLRLSQTVNAGFEAVRPDDDYVLLHESDLQSPRDIAKKLLATGKCPIAGWPVLPLAGGGEIFYDTWAYRRFNVYFSNLPPYHPCYDDTDLFEVDSVGSVWLLSADDVRRGLRCDKLACVELCEKLRADFGRTIWVDPTLKIIQPRELWTSTRHI